MNKKFLVFLGLLISFTVLKSNVSYAIDCNAALGFMQCGGGGCPSNLRCIPVGDSPSVDFDGTPSWAGRCNDITNIPCNVQPTDEYSSCPANYENIFLARYSSGNQVYTCTPNIPNDAIERYSCKEHNPDPYSTAGRSIYACSSTNTPSGGGGGGETSSECKDDEVVCYSVETGKQLKMEKIKKNGVL